MTWKEHIREAKKLFDPVVTIACGATVTLIAALAPITLSVLTSGTITTNSGVQAGALLLMGAWVTTRAALK